MGEVIDLLPRLQSKRQAHLDELERAITAQLFGEVPASMHGIFYESSLGYLDTAPSEYVAPKDDPA